MKKILGLAAILICLGMGKAHAFGDPDYIRSSGTVHAPISVSSSVATQVDSGIVLTGRFVLVLDNEGSDNLRCSFNASVTQTANGFLVFPGQPLVLKLASTIPLYCIATGSSAINVSLIQGKSR